ncbi:hypothetical protein HDG35_002582 [Paraburkholderia sp. JPY681]|nr:hypothetical protein [Paraburkholderia atlantica]
MLRDDLIAPSAQIHARLIRVAMRQSRVDLAGGQSTSGCDDVRWVGCSCQCGTANKRKRDKQTPHCWPCIRNGAASSRRRVTKPGTLTAGNRRPWASRGCT